MAAVLRLWLTKPARPGPLRYATTITISACLCGCVYMGSGRYPLASGEGVVQTLAGLTSTVRTVDYEAMVQFEGFSDDVGFIGLGVPIIPIVRVTSGRMAVSIRFDPNTLNGTFHPRSLKVLVEGKEYAPLKVRMSDTRCGARSPSIDISEPLRIRKPVCLWFDFTYLSPPENEFSLIAQDFPRINYRIERDFHGGLGKQ